MFDLRIVAVFLVFAVLLGCTGAPSSPQPPQGQAQAPAQNAIAPAQGNQPAAAPQQSSGGSGNLDSCLSTCATAGTLENTCKAGCYLAAGGETGDVSNCEPMLSIKEGKGLYSTCVSNAASTAADASFCSRITEQTQFNNCITLVAQAKGDASVCGSVKDDMSYDVCVSAAADAKNDASMCGSIRQEFMKEPCVEGAQP